MNTRVALSLRTLIAVFLSVSPLLQAHGQETNTIPGIESMSVHENSIDIVSASAVSDLKLTVRDSHGTSVEKLKVKVGEEFVVTDDHHFSTSYRLSATQADTANLEEKSRAQFPGDPVERISGKTISVRSYAAAAKPNADSPPAWPDTFTTRLEALALIQTLNTDILGSRSATRTLQGWCKDHALAADPTIRAHLLPGENKAPSDEQRERLQVSATEPVKYRHVQLQCGTHVLSDAENWYVPSRLTPAMNRQLETTDTPFGKAVETLKPYRVTFGVKSLWSPLPQGWESGKKLADPTERTLKIPAALFEHDAILYTGEHRAFSEVREVYQRDVLAFAAPP
jgi:hypothetical protein